jgi:fatty acid desaturase
MAFPLVLAFLTGMIPLIMYGSTKWAIRLGPNPWIGFRISSRVMSDPARWRQVHSELVPLLRKQLLLSLGIIPVTAALIVLPDAFPLALMGYIAIVLGGIAWAARAIIRSIASDA